MTHGPIRLTWSMSDRGNAPWPKALSTPCAPNSAARRSKQATLSAAAAGAGRRAKVTADLASSNIHRGTTRLRGAGLLLRQRRRLACRLHGWLAGVDLSCNPFRHLPLGIHQRLVLEHDDHR